MCWNSCTFLNRNCYCKSRTKNVHLLYKSVHDFECAAIKNIAIIIIMLLDVVIGRVIIMEDDIFGTVTKLIVGNTEFNRNEFIVNLIKNEEWL